MPRLKIENAPSTVLVWMVRSLGFTYWRPPCSVVPCLVHFNSAAITTERRGKIAGTHGLTNAMGQEPRRLVLHFENAGQLVGADALLARYHQVNRLQHLVQRHAGMLENSADLDGELLAALATFFQTVAHNAFRVFRARLGAHAREIIDPTANRSTVRADNAIGPKDAFQKLESLGFIVEVRGRENRHGCVRTIWESA